MDSLKFAFWKPICTSNPKQTNIFNYFRKFRHILKLFYTSAS